MLGLLSVPALVALNGLFVATEFSLVAVRRTRIEELVQQGTPGASAVEAALNRLDRSIAATQLGITLASIGLGWVGEPALARLVHPLFDFLEPSWGQVVVNTVGTGLAFLLITFMHVTFGELVPKAVALQASDRTALWTARMLLTFVWLTRPIIVLMNATGNWVLRLLGYRPPGGEAMVHSVQELELLIEDTEEAGILEPEQAEFVHNVFHLSGKRVGDCLVPRDKMATLELHTPPDQVLEKVRHGAHTRMPVYDGEIDNIVGVVNTKDLFYLFSLQGVVVLEDAMYPALFLKPEENVGTALKLFKQSRRPMALVRDEAGKIIGLITLEDILEEIVGDIEDEHDRPTPKLSRRRLRIAKPPGKPLPPSKPPARTS
jgi:CBS domain containing-hemolysin-like protein